jgi:hypothetical protein
MLRYYKADRLVKNKFALKLFDSVRNTIGKGMVQRAFTDRIDGRSNPPTAGSIENN